MKITTYLLVAAGSLLSLSAYAQNSAPFAGGVKLQQAGSTSPALGLLMKAKNTTPYTGDVTLNWIQPASNGILKVSSFGSGAGDVSVTTLDLSSATDVGTSILGIANGGTGASTANGALNNLLPSQTGNGTKFLQTDGTNATWQNAVTSVGLALPTNEFTISNSPVTSTGTLTAAWKTQAANTVFAAPDGSTGAPTFRALVAADIPNLDASKITTGTLPIARGGTGNTTFNSNGAVYYDGTKLTSTSGMTDGQVMIGSSSGAPTAATLTAGSGIAITNGSNSISIATNLTNVTNKTRVNLSATSVSYAANTPPAGFTLAATSVINVTIYEAGGFPINATVTDINTTSNTYDFIITGYPTAGSFALVTFQN